MVPSAFLLNISSFLTSSGNVNRLMLAAMFSMSYVGMPHIWYGDEIGMVGGKDPDCRRPFDWRYTGDPRKVALRDFYGTITRLRRDTAVLSRGDFTALATNGKGYAFARDLDGKVAVSFFNAGPSPVTLTLPAGVLKDLAGGEALELKVLVGSDSFPRSVGDDLKTGRMLRIDSQDMEITVPGMSGAILLN